MKKMTKIFALMLVLVLVIGTFAACGEKKEASVEGEYTYWGTLDTNVSETHSSYSELMMYQEMEKRTGVKVNFLHPTKGSTGSEAFQILLTSADMPDMVEYNWKSYPGGPDMAIENKVIISLNKYMKESAPNYYSYMEGDKAVNNENLYKIQSITNNGNYYGFKNLSIGKNRCFGGLLVRKDLLDKWGLDVPVTIDDWTNVLKTAKENGIAKPLTGNNNLFAIKGENSFNIAWEVAKQFHVENDKVVLSLENLGYKEYIKQMSDWYKAGYIDKDYITDEDNVIQGNMTNNTSVACFGYIGGTMGKLIPAMKERNPDYNIAACPFPVLKEGETIKIQDIAAESAEPSIAITYQCGKDNEERYKEAMKWCDYLYSDEGIILKSFGVEGKTFNKTTNPDGSEKYEYIITSPEEQEKVGAHSVNAVLYYYMRPANAPGFNQHNDYLDGYYPYQEQKDALVIWNEHIENVRKNVLPSLSYTDEESVRINEINSQCRDKLDSTVSKIICNELPLSEFDNAVSDAKKKGYDELIKIHQAAYDRYTSVKK
ncbi:MAG: extracellular solute-binding protein [Clostridia bacterium]|nr:extracellular solute-binding protein [Clostridia bacterium]